MLPAPDLLMVDDIRVAINALAVVWCAATGKNFKVHPLEFPDILPSSSFAPQPLCPFRATETIRGSFVYDVY
jgi:hypothetical protein